jgi:hypothetical protein
MAILSRNAASWHHIPGRLEAALEGRRLDWSEQAQAAQQERYAAMLA